MEYLWTWRLGSRSAAFPRLNGKGLLAMGGFEVICFSHWISNLIFLFLAVTRSIDQKS